LADLSAVHSSCNDRLAVPEFPTKNSFHVPNEDNINFLWCRSGFGSGDGFSPGLTFCHFLPTLVWKIHDSSSVASNSKNELRSRLLRRAADMDIQSNLIPSVRLCGFTTQVNDL
jgi:hypothetical protein